MTEQQPLTRSQSTFSESQYPGTVSSTQGLEEMACPSCHQRIAVPKNSTVKAVTCPYCRQTIVLPDRDCICIPICCNVM